MPAFNSYDGAVRLHPQPAVGHDPPALFVQAPEPLHDLDRREACSLTFVTASDCKQ